MENRIDLGMVLLEMENWKKVYLDSELQICACGNGSAREERDSFLDLLAVGERQRFCALLTEAALDQPVSGIYFSRRDTPLEILVANRGNGYDLFFREIESRLRSLEQLATFYRHFLTTPTPTCITDRQGTLLEANRAFLEFYGYSLQEVIGSNPRILKSGRQSPDAYHELWRTITDPAIGHWSGELINRKRNGEEATVYLTVSAVRRGSELCGFVGAAIDITRRKLLEAQLASMNQELEDLNRLKNEVMAVTSHDLKAPINGIISRVHLLLQGLDDMPRGKVREHLERIVEAGGRLTGFINELLDLEKIESGRYQLHVERLRLDSLLQLCIEINAPAAALRGIRLKLTSEGKTISVAADAAKLEQVFNNLLSNAVKYSPDGSEVEVVYSEYPGGGRQIAVLDRGPGIPEEDLAKIFDRYYQVRKKGAVPKRVFGVGLGLAIVRNIVELHGGSVAVANRPGGGSIFTVHLPDLPAGAIRGMAALVIDPRDAVFRYLQGPLALRSISHFFARTPFEVQRVLENEQPDLLFVDAVGCSADLFEQLASYAAGGRAVLAAIGGEAERDERFLHWFSEPVLEMEILEFLDSHRLNSRGLQ